MLWISHDLTSPVSCSWGPLLTRILILIYPVSCGSGEVERWRLRYSLLGASSEEFHYVISQRVSALVLPRQLASRSEWSTGVGLLILEMACASLVLGGVIKSSMAVAAYAFHLLHLYLPRCAERSIRTKTMYPRVKAKDKIFNCNHSGSCLNSNYLQSRASENKQEEDLHIIVAKIPKIYIPSVLMSETESKDMKKHIRGAEIEPIQKPKTSPVLRPRAVVSSPDNDALIGSINKSEENKAKTGLKSNGHVSKRASQRKNIDTNVKFSHRPVATKSGTSLKDHK
ncbi:unnamed protein product [Brassica napus]|uniref:(rape) hypothetical protein n=1 Tax=Brassica napus TaxID=3708 RepID=A0A816ZW30_BRANA|nr:unnamed protein product [Brassica napus]